MQKVNIIIDVEKCHDCNNCFLSCKDEHWENDHLPYALAQPRFGQKWVNVVYKERGQYPLQDVSSFPHMCMHCDEPTCMKVAKNGAVYKRDDGIVIIDPVKAKGQRDIVDACPYKVIFWNEELQLPQKCTMCAHLLDEGTWEQPRCTFACPTGAMSFLRATDEEMAQQVQLEGLENYRPELGTKPRIYFKNLYRFTKCHLAGSVELHDQKECAEGAKITAVHLATNQSFAGVTNNYGDFKIDHLEPNSGEYSVSVEYPGYGSKTVKVDLQTSVNVGTVYLERV
ncbi:MAG: carboxypeptidase regulatory-like domain-containing protein [Peptococcaceae bacterium]|nr:carboxypeptidase regulatory-like domain-containing protein [Peptococcaceae bacterium]